MTANTLPAPPAPVFTPTRLDVWRIRLCAVLVIVNVVQHVLLLAGVPEFYRRVSTGAVPVVVTGGQVSLSPETVAHDAAVRGMSAAAYAGYFLALNLLIAAGFWAAAALVLAKAGGHWYRWLVAVVLIYFPSGQLWPIAQISQVNYHLLSFFGVFWPLYLLFLYLYPDGRAVPRWSRWPMTGFLLTHLVFQVVGVAAEQLGDALVLPESALPVAGAVILLALAFVLVCQVYRYLRVSGPVERKQIQWFVAALGLFVVSSLLYSSFTGDSDLTSGDGFWSDLDLAFGLLVPLAITIAILRYRLWDIDLIIRRTLIYGVLSGLLALLYFGSVVLFETALRGLTGGGSQAAIVLSTLLIAALFGPLRARVQRAIDQRFYRRKYD
ncbi:MAG: hypothetical protein IT317_01530, partial [Anaerolineales bacterium]|nr:hypothetical protein [Anaerolineales bacterium]